MARAQYIEHEQEKIILLGMIVKITTIVLQSFHALIYDSLRVNRFLSLTLSHHYPSVTSTLSPHSFPSVMRSGPTLSSAFSHLVCPLRLLSGWSPETANNLFKLCWS